SLTLPVRNSSTSSSSHRCSSFRGVSVTKQPAAEETTYFLFTPEWSRDVCS
ncbi:Hypothetical protein SMAX5B_006873, partial [Scophthalmus maximus]